MRAEAEGSVEGRRGEGRGVKERGGEERVRREEKRVSKGEKRGVKERGG